MDLQVSMDLSVFVMEQNNIIWKEVGSILVLSFE